MWTTCSPKASTRILYRSSAGSFSKKMPFLAMGFPASRCSSLVSAGVMGRGRFLGRVGIGGFHLI